MPAVSERFEQQVFQVIQSSPGDRINFDCWKRGFTGKGYDLHFLAILVACLSKTLQSLDFGESLYDYVPRQEPWHFNQYGSSDSFLSEPRHAVSSQTMIHSLLRPDGLSDKLALSNRPFWNLQSLALRGDCDLEDRGWNLGRPSLNMETISQYTRLLPSLQELIIERASIADQEGTGHPILPLRRLELSRCLVDGRRFDISVLEMCPLVKTFCLLHDDEKMSVFSFMSLILYWKDTLENLTIAMQPLPDNPRYRQDTAHRPIIPRGYMSSLGALKRFHVFYGLLFETGLRKIFKVPSFTKDRKRDKYQRRGLESGYDYDDSDHGDESDDDGKFTFDQIEEVARDLLSPAITELRLFGMYCGLPCVDNLALLLDNKAEFCPDLKLLIVEIWDVALAEDVRIPTQIMKLCERNDIECIILGNRSGKFLRPHSPGLTPWEGLGKVRSDWRTLLEM